MGGIAIARRWIAAALLPGLLAGGCRSTPLPAFPAMTDDEVLGVLRERAERIDTVEATGVVTLRAADGRRAVLDAALVADAPDRLRVRAWKLDRVVLDLTSIPEGVWIQAADDQDGRVPDLPGARIGRAWALFTGAFFARDRAGEPEVVDRDEHDLWLRRNDDDDDEGGAVILCRVDRRTLVPRRYEVCDRGGATRYAVDLDRYRPVGDIAWPHRLTMSADGQRITIAMSDVVLNDGTAPAAFTPPARAVRQR